MKATRLVRIFAAAGALLALGSVPLTSAMTAQPPASAASKPAEGALDVIIFRNGKTVQGNILSETDTQIRVKVIGPGGLSVETSYDKANILKIDRAAEVAADAVKTDPAAAPKADPVSDPKKPDAPKEGAAKVYILEVKGEFGRDISATPLRQIVLNDIKGIQPDILVLKMDVDYKVHGHEKKDIDTFGAQQSYNQLETARQLQTMLTDDIRDDPEWKVKPRMVCWVKKALGGGAFLPFIFPEIYYTSDSLHGGLGYLEFIFKGVGDETPQEKQYSLRLGRAEGLALKGGHEPKIIRAMSRADYVLSVKYEGGKPVLLEREPEGPDEELLTDDASEPDKRDTIQDVARYKGNDVLTLNAELAYRLGVSSGTVDTVEDLMYKLGVSRAYTIVKGKGGMILSEWGKQVTAAERNFNRKIDEYRRTQPEPPGGYQERTAARGKQIRLLNEMLDILKRYGEAINPEEVGADPEQAMAQIEVWIEQLKTQQRLDRR